MRPRILPIATIGLFAMLAVDLTAQRCTTGPGTQVRLRAGAHGGSPPSATPVVGAQHRYGQGRRAGVGALGRGGRGAPNHRSACAAPEAGCAANLAGRTTGRGVTQDFLDRLQRALAAEVDAGLQYEAASTAFGVPHFSNLARAERHHEAAIRAVITFLGGTPAEPRATPATPAPDRAAADARCAGTERTMIETYRSLITDSPDPEVTVVLERIQGANRRHLAAVGG